MDKKRYSILRSQNNNPISLAYSVFNEVGPIKIKDKGIFERALTIWLITKNTNLLNGCLTIKNYLDKKFGI